MNQSIFRRFCRTKSLFFKIDFKLTLIDIPEYRGNRTISPSSL